MIYNSPKNTEVVSLNTYLKDDNSKFENKHAISKREMEKEL